MKTSIKYISLLLFCGLMLPFYNPVCYKVPLANCHSKFVKAQTEVTEVTGNAKSTGFSFVKDIAGKLFPILKSLN